MKKFISEFQSGQGSFENRSSAILDIELVDFLFVDKFRFHKQSESTVNNLNCEYSQRRLRLSRYNGNVKSTHLGTFLQCVQQLLSVVAKK